MMRRFVWPRRHARSMVMGGGLMLVLLGVLQVTGVWFELMTWLQVLVLNWQTHI
ncbi:MAG: hypothetical protein ABIR39_24335 [Nocardioides sp.]|uniref:hypothetical protein n=1 Tax=Nocardioides sp. TaxID=35761 RepID=UPI003265171D